jgi:hypothetical protein
LNRSFDAFSVKAKSFVFLIERERKIDLFLALTDCDPSPVLLGLLILGALFGPWQVAVSVETIKITHNMVTLRTAMKTFHFQNLDNLFEEIHYCLEILL